MNGIKKIALALGFTRKRSEFELLETEKAAAVFMNGMADAETINDYVLRETMKKPLPDKPPYIDYMIKNVLTASDVSMESDWYKVKRAITDGQTVMFVGNEERAAIIDTRGYEHRSVGTTENEKVVRGPQEGFNEKYNSAETHDTPGRSCVRDTRDGCPKSHKGSHSLP